MAVVLALGAALSNALTTILQRKAAEKAPPDHAFRLRLIIFLVRRPIWLLGMVAMTGGFLFQVTALHFGGLSTVQPLLAGEIVFLLAIMWIWFGTPLGIREWAGGFAISAGLGAFLAVAKPGGGEAVSDGATWLEAGLAGAGCIAAVLTLAVVGERSGTWRAVFIGSGAAILFAFAAALMKQSNTIVREGWGHLFATWPPYALVAVGLGGLYLAQNAFHAGSVGASQSALTIVDPMASILIGVTVFGEKIRTEPWQVLVEVVALSIMVVGILVLSRSPVIFSAHELTSEKHPR